MRVYPSDDVRQHGDDRIDHRDKIMKFYFDIRDFGLGPLQRERFTFLLGPRYKGSHKFKLVGNKHLTLQENYMKTMETLREIYWESLRAPDDVTVTYRRNPYRREKLIKKLMGKTREERLENKAMFKEMLKEHKLEMDKSYIQKDLDVQDRYDAGRGRRVDIAKRRAKLGFDDNGAEEMEDSVIDRIEG